MIKKETFQFLADLSVNNNREWFSLHKDSYQQAKENVEEFTNTVLDLFREFDTSISPAIDAKKCVMRLYRDVRFSKDKSPYKNNFGIGISSKGKVTDGQAGYYIHIQPQGCFLAGGCWMPPADNLKLIRQEIDYNTQDFLNIIEDKNFKAYFGHLDQEEKLKTAPKGYAADHPHIDLLKLKSFTVTHYLEDELLMDQSAPDNVVKGLKLLYPFNVFLNQAMLS